MEVSTAIFGKEITRGRAIGVQKWEKSEAAIENGMIYQTTTLPAGDYSLRLNVHEQNKFSEGEACLAVVEGADFFESENAEGRVLASFDMSGTSSGATVETCRFSLDKETTVSLGWHVNLPADAVEKKHAHFGHLFVGRRNGRIGTVSEEL